MKEPVENLQTEWDDSRTCTAFHGNRRIASGSLADVAVKAKKAIDKKGDVSVLIFDDTTGEQVELDFRGTTNDVLRRISQGRRNTPKDEPRGPGRPRVGVVGREVTLLPGHWSWLDKQPGGASITLRKLVQSAKRDGASEEKERNSREACYRFMSAMAGNLPGFEEATRALFSKDSDRLQRFTNLVKSWPSDIRGHSIQLAKF